VDADGGLADLGGVVDAQQVAEGVDGLVAFGLDAGRGKWEGGRAGRADAGAAAAEAAEEAVTTRIPERGTRPARGCTPPAPAGRRKEEAAAAVVCISPRQYMLSDAAVGPVQ
jgi:hypothetical protein